MPNPDDAERDGPDMSMAVSENGHHYNDQDSDSKEDDAAMTDPNQTSDGAIGGEVKKKYDPKDPFRPRRKKARRACFACQRAHLTCGKFDPSFFFSSGIVFLLFPQPQRFQNLCLLIFRSHSPSPVLQSS